jgi:hypothetical protein
MRWIPKKGHVPRGFCGATSKPEDVKLVLVVAEPGDPKFDEVHPAGPPEATLKSATDRAYYAFRDGTGLFHRNLRRVLDLCLPRMTYEDQMRATWIAESVLCSAQTEGGRVPGEVTRECRRRYLEPQLKAYPNAVIVALGGKAAKRLKGVENVIKAFAVAPPGCNSKRAEPSWKAAADEVKALMKDR